MSWFDLDKWQEIAIALRQNRLRAVMTAAGVFWGIFMLVVMLGFGNGLKQGVTTNMLGFASNAFYVWPQRTSLPYQGLQPGRSLSFDSSDIEAIRAHVSGIDSLAPRLQLGGYREGNNVSRGDKTGNFSVMGDYPAFQRIALLGFHKGRFINSLDIDERRKSAVIGDQVVRVLFEPGEDPLGKAIRIQGKHFQVVGVFGSPQAGDEGERQASTIYIPFTTFQSSFGVPNEVGWFALGAAPEASPVALERQVRRLLARRHRVHPDDGLAIGSFNVADRFNSVQNLFAGIQYFIWFVGVLTLLSGVLGVSNIMVIVVKERTKEIGLRKALGATPRSIIGLVVQEAVALTAIAGYAGLVVSTGLLELSKAAFKGRPGSPMSQPEIELGTAGIALFVLLVAGLLAALTPARHAARIHPVEALRAE